MSLFPNPGLPFPMSASLISAIQQHLESYEVGIERERMQWEDERSHFLHFIKEREDENAGLKEVIQSQQKQIDDLNDVVGRRNRRIQELMRTMDRLKGTMAKEFPDSSVVPPRSCNMPPPGAQSTTLPRSSHAPGGQMIPPQRPSSSPSSSDGRKRARPSSLNHEDSTERGGTYDLFTSQRLFLEAPRADPPNPAPPLPPPAPVVEPSWPSVTVKEEPRPESDTTSKARLQPNVSGLGDQVTPSTDPHPSRKPAMHFYRSKWSMGAPVLAPAPLAPMRPQPPRSAPATSSKSMRALREIQNIDQREEETLKHHPQPARDEASKTSAQPPSYAYVEVVRGKQRQSLPGFLCPQCRGFAESCQQHGTFTKEQIESLVQKCSRHRQRFTPYETPDGFWNLSFADSHNHTPMNDD